MSGRVEDVPTQKSWFTDPLVKTQAHRPLMNKGTQSFAEYPIGLIDPRLDVIEVIELHRAALALYQPSDQSRAACCPG
jgi:hypothetical protein